MTKKHEAGFPVFAEQGEVQIDAPHGATASLTPDAATDTAARLIDCARRARAQQANDDPVAGAKL